MSEYVPSGYKDCKCGKRVDDATVLCSECIDVLFALVNTQSQKDGENEPNPKIK